MAAPQADIDSVVGPLSGSALRARESLPTSLRDTVQSGRHLASPTRDSADTALLPTTVAAVDHLLSGGLPRGRLVELTGMRSCGRFSTLLAALAATTRSGETAALVDLGDCLDPRTAAEAGIDLQRLLWIRPVHLKDAMISTELALHAGFDLVTLDLGTPPVPGGRGTEAGWVRLARAAAERQAALFISTPYRVSHTAATTVMAVNSLQPLWRRHGSSPWLLGGLLGHVHLEKSRLAAKNGTESFRFMTPEGRLLSTMSHPLSVDPEDVPVHQLLSAR